MADETTTTQKYDIKETMDVVNFCDQLLDKMAVAKSDDGKISAGEAVAAITTSIPAVVKAWVGKDKIDDELKELSPEETMQLAVAGANLARKFLALVMPGIEVEIKEGEK